MKKDKQSTAIKLFNDKQIRTHWDADQEKWYFSIVDVIEILTESPNPQVYWRVMKKRLKDEANETVTNCNGLKMKAADGKMRKTDMVDNEKWHFLIVDLAGILTDNPKPLLATGKYFQSRLKKDVIT